MTVRLFILPMPVAHDNDKKILKLLSDEATLRQGFTLLVRQYSAPLYAKVRRIVVSHEDADDVMQNAFIKAWNNLGSFRGDSKLSTWLFRIAVNEALDFLRRQKVMPVVESEDLQSVARHLMADDFFDGDEAQAMLQAAIAKLPAVQRTVFCLRYYDEMKYSEMSAMLGTSEGALKASYHLAVKKIVETIKQSDS